LRPIGTRRDGYRPRPWQTRLGPVEPQIPKLRRGSYYPSFLEPRKTSERALVAVVQEAYVHGVSTRKVDDRVQALGLTGIGKSHVSNLGRGLVRRGLRGVRLVISDAHEGFKQAVARILGATWQRGRVHLMRNGLSHVPKGQHEVVVAAIRTVFAQPDHGAASVQWRQVAESLRARFPTLGAILAAAEDDVLAVMHFPVARRTKLHSTNPLDRLTKEVNRRTDVGGIFPNEASVVRLVRALLSEQNDEWAIARRYMTLETLAETTGASGDHSRPALKHRVA